MSAPSTPTPDATSFRVVQVHDVTFDFVSGAAQVILREAEGRGRTLLVPVALPDATTLFHAQRHHVGRRPSTNELTVSILQEVHADIIAVRIVRALEGVFFAELDVMTPRGRRVFDSRPSDAIALALRQVVPAPLLVAEELLTTT